MLRVELKKEIDNSYNIEIGTQILAKANQYIKKVTKAKKLLIVTNTTVFGLYYEKLERALKNFEVEKIVLKDGEKYKNSQSLEKIWQKALEFKLERSDAIIALGGGVVGDIAGFAASSYLRGIDFIQIPTTLLSQVDSSIGGKVAINHPLGKNMLGAFYQPKLVLIDISTLKTLPLKELKTGLGEVLKYAFIEKSCASSKKTNLFSYLNQHKKSIYNYDLLTLETLVTQCCLLKKSVVEKDEKEDNLRAILNFGHTIGHALEKTTKYKKYTHGEAISLGMVAIFDMAKNKNLIEDSYFEEAIKLLKEYEILQKMPSSLLYPTKKIAKATQNDKKVKNSKVRFVVPQKKGCVSIMDDFTMDEIKKGIDNISKICE